MQAQGGQGGIISLVRLPAHSQLLSGCSTPARTASAASVRSPTNRTTKEMVQPCPPCPAYLHVISLVALPSGVLQTSVQLAQHQGGLAQ